RLIMHIPRLFSFLLKIVVCFLALFFVGHPFTANAAPAVDNNHPAIRAGIAVQLEVTDEWMKQPEVLGTSVGVSGGGTPMLTVYIDRDATNAGEIIRNLPQSVRGVGINIHLTDKFRALKNPHHPTPTPTPNPTPTPTPAPTPTPSPAASHTAKQTSPIYLGTSGGWSKDLANGYCCGGTLGSLVSIGGVQYILSNYHVFES